MLLSENHCHCNSFTSRYSCSCPGCGGAGGGGAGGPSAGPGTGVAGTDGLGGGGGAGGFDPGSGHHTGGIGGKGVVIIKEAGATGYTATGMWSMQEQYDYSLAGTWQG